jgi:serine/threonine protein kinase
MELTPGARLGHYEILGPLGAGGMGRVFRARDVKLDRQVAIKVLRDDWADDPEWLPCFEREARLLAMSHPAYQPMKEPSCAFTTNWSDRCRKSR